MGYFPFFIDLSGKEGLIVGGGVVALRKIEKLLPFGPKLTVAAPSFQKEIEEIKEISLLKKPFSEEMVDGKYFVVAATDHKELNHRIFRLCEERNILINAVDDKEACTFIFPSLVKKGKLTVGISTGGASPSAAMYIKDHLNQWVPEAFDEILDFLGKSRPVVWEKIPTEKERAVLFARLFQTCMEKGRALTDRELEEIFSLYPKPQFKDYC